MHKLENHLERPTTKDYYRNKFYIQDVLINRLENAEYEILKINTLVGFTHEYIYYFFVGMYFSSSNSNKELINEIIENIHLKQNSLIAIFTIHHTQNKELLENILAHCVCSLDKTKPAELTTEETHFMGELLSQLPTDIVSKKPIAETRRELRELEDKTLAKSGKPNEIEKTSISYEIGAIEINKGLRIIEVLGQILKNRGGSFEKRIVQDTLDNTISLGLRILSILLETLRTDEFTNWLGLAVDKADEEHFANHNKHLSDERKKRFVERSIQMFSYVMTVTMLNRISDSISTEKMNEAVVLLANKNPTPAYRMVSFLARLSQNGIDTDELKDLIATFDKNKNHWAKRTLSYYVQVYLNTHNVVYNERQKIFSIIKVDYIPNKFIP